MRRTTKLSCRRHNDNKSCNHLLYGGQLQRLVRPQAAASVIRSDYQLPTPTRSNHNLCFKVFDTNSLSLQQLTILACFQRHSRSAERTSSAAADVTTERNPTTYFTAVSCSDWFGLKPLQVLYVLLTDHQHVQTTIWVATHSMHFIPTSGYFNAIRFL
jgi:hypothetical protein